MKGMGHVSGRVRLGNSNSYIQDFVYRGISLMRKTLPVGPYSLGRTTGGYMCLSVLAMKTFFSPIFDLPGEKNPGEVFRKIGKGKIRKFWNFVGREEILAPF